MLLKTKAHSCCQAFAPEPEEMKHTEPRTPKMSEHLGIV